MHLLRSILLLALAALVALAPVIANGENGEGHFGDCSPGWPGPEHPHHPARRGLRCLRDEARPTKSLVLGSNQAVRDVIIYVEVTHKVTRASERMTQPFLTSAIANLCQGSRSPAAVPR